MARTLTEFLASKGQAVATASEPTDVCYVTAKVYFETPIDGAPTPAFAGNVQDLLNEDYGFKDKTASACGVHLRTLYGGLLRLKMLGETNKGVQINGVEYKLVRVTPEGEPNPAVTPPANTPTQGGNAPSPRKN